MHRMLHEHGIPATAWGGCAGALSCGMTCMGPACNSVCLWKVWALLWHSGYFLVAASVHGRVLQLSDTHS